MSQHPPITAYARIARGENVPITQVAQIAKSHPEFLRRAQESRPVGSYRGWKVYGEGEHWRAVPPKDWQTHWPSGYSVRSIGAGIDPRAGALRSAIPSIDEVIRGYDRPKSGVTPPEFWRTKSFIEKIEYPTKTPPPKPSYPSYPVMSKASVFSVLQPRLFSSKPLRLAAHPSRGMVKRLHKLLGVR